MEIGLGLRPDLCGKGYGKFFLKQIEEYILSKFQVNKITFTVASFNTRAIRVYEAGGYKVIEEQKRFINGNNYNFKVMEKI